jgi:colanic acid/amylovoran biosynthesis glycosyltransferase
MLKEVGLVSSPIVTTFHGYDINAYPRKHGTDCYQRLFTQGDQFTAGSKFARQRLLDLGAPSERVQVWPMGISADRFAFRERHRSDGEPVRLLSVARLVEEKGLAYAVQAVAGLVRQGYEVRYRIVGEGERRSGLEALVQRLGLGDTVELCGAMARNQVIEQYDWAHLFLMPGVVASNGAVETQGLVLAEAQASGLPVVATEVGGMPESIRDGVSGFLVPERDVEALVDRTALLIDHAERWAEMGRAGRAHIESKYDTDERIDELVDLYRQLL